MNTSIGQIALFVSCILLFPSAHAYLDPGSGSIIIQGTIAAIAAVGMTIKIYWYKIKGFFTRSSPADSTPDTVKVANTPDE